MQHADSVVVGYTENSWLALLNDYITGNLQKSYNYPYYSGFINFRFDRKNMLKRKKYFYPDTFEFSRSCFNKCNFCVIPEFAGSDMNFRSLETLVNEIKHYKSKQIVFLESSPTEDIDK